MKLLAISDTYIPYAFMEAGFASLRGLGVEVEVRRWEHPTLVELQEANLAIEKGGPEAVPLPAELMADLDDFDILVVQFTPVSPGVHRGGRESQGDRRAARRRGERRRAVCHRAGHLRAEHAGPQRPGGGRMRDGADPGRDPQPRPVPRLPEEPANGGGRSPTATRFPNCTRRRSAWSATGRWPGWWPATCRPSAAG